MSSNAVEKLTGVVTRNVDRDLANLESRLAGFEHLVAGVGLPEIEPPVRVRVTAAHEGKWVGETGTLRRIDKNDTWMTFLVNIDGKEDGPWWVYDVVELEAEETRSVDELAAALMLSEKSCESLRTALEQSRNQAAARATELSRFQETVRDVAIRVAEEQGWCDNGLNEVLNELGLEPKRAKEYEIKVVVEYTLTARVEPGKEDDVNASWIESSIDFEDGVRFDSDWAEYNVDEANVAVRSYEETGN